MINNTIKNFLSPYYWFNLSPRPFADLTLKIILGFILLLLVLTAVASAVKKKWARSLYAGFWKSLYYFFLANFIIGLFLTFFNYEMVPFLSARFWFLLWGIGIIIWLAFLYKIIAIIPQKKAFLEKEKEFKKYLPK